MSGPDRPSPSDENPDDQDDAVFHSADVPDRPAPGDDEDDTGEDPKPHSPDVDMPHSGDVEVDVIEIEETD
jgi:hypothetical protein